jgi:hypothetical protein
MHAIRHAILLVDSGEPNGTLTKPEKKDGEAAVQRQKSRRISTIDEGVDSNQPLPRLSNPEFPREGVASPAISETLAHRLVV